MRFSRIAILPGALSLLAGAAACSGSVDVTSGGTTATGTGGTGGTTSSSSTTATTATASSTGTGGGDNGMPSDMYPAPHGNPPQVVSYGGPVLAAPTIIPVFFSNGDPMLTASMTDFASKVGATQYWAANTTEYGVGAASSGMPVNLVEAAPATIDDSAIQTWLEGKLNGNDPAWPVADANTIYVLHYPASTTVTLSGSTSCQQFGGYHSNVTLDANHGSANVSYAVVPSCANFAGMSLLDATTSTESHELLEASTDPYPMTNPGYLTVDSEHPYWARVLGGGEIGDMCAQFDSSFTVFPELPLYMVQRSWSNKAASDGHDPCVPALANTVYFNSVPKYEDTIHATNMGQAVLLRGVKIAVGASKVVEVDLFSEAATSGPWTVTAKDASALMGGTPELEFSFDKDSGVNGEKLHLTINVKSAGKHGTETFILDSTLGSEKNLWIGIVGAM